MLISYNSSGRGGSCSVVGRGWSACCRPESLVELPKRGGAVRQLAWLITKRSQVRILPPLLLLMLCACCLQEVLVPMSAAWPECCPHCRCVPFALMSIGRQDGMYSRRPGRKVARTTRDCSAGRGSRALPKNFTGSVPLG